MIYSELKLQRLAKLALTKRIATTVLSIILFSFFVGTKMAEKSNVGVLKFFGKHYVTLFICLFIFAKETIH